MTFVNKMTIFKSGNCVGRNEEMVESKLLKNQGFC